MNVCVYGASSVKTRDLFIDKTEELGRMLAKRGHGLVYGGGGNGLMGAIARGFTSEGGEVVGVAPSFFKVDGVLYDKCTSFIHTETMRERKMIMEEKSDAFIVTPGGVGTFDEFFEILTLRQLGRHSKPIAIFNIDGYFDELELLMKKALSESLLSEKSKELYGIFDNIDELIKYIENAPRETLKISEMKFVK